MTELQKKKLETFETIIENQCDIYGVKSTIEQLLEFGFTKEELLEMQFEQNDIDNAFEEWNA